MEQMCTLDDFLQIVGLSANIFSTEVWWRGQPKIEDDVLPSVFREKVFPSGWTSQKERDLTVRFLLGATTRHANWVEGDNAHRLAAMRHHGLATRLLDWTLSPLFALFFAVRDDAKHDAALWALCPASLNQIEFGRSNILSPYIDQEVKKLFKVPFQEVSYAPRKVAAVAIREVDIHMSVQLAAFTVHGDSTPLNVRSDSEKFLLCFRIPSDAKSDLKDQLFVLGIRQSNLFPDLDNLAQELNRLARREDTEVLAQNMGE